MAPSLLERQLLRLRNGAIAISGLGRPPTGTRPRELVWRRETARLWRYTGAAAPMTPPVVIVHSLISESTILDLLPAASMVGGLLDAGADVFLLDWEPCGPADADNTLATYVDELVPDATAHARRISDADQVTMIGYCLGGVIALLHAASRPAEIRNLVTLTTPVAFGELGFMSNMFVEGRLDPDDVIDARGLIPAAVLDAGFRLTKPTEPLTQPVTVWETLWDDRRTDSFTAINRWARRQLPFPGAAFREIVDSLIRDDALADGAIELAGRRIELAAVRCALLNVYCTDDELVPPASARPLTGLVGSTDADELALDCGHVGLVAGSAATAAMESLSEWIAARSDQRG